MKSMPKRTLSDITRAAYKLCANSNDPVYAPQLADALKITEALALKVIAKMDREGQGFRKV